MHRRREPTVWRKLTAFWVAVETLFAGALPDTMCGFRVYPLASTVALLDAVTLGSPHGLRHRGGVRLYWRRCLSSRCRPTVIYPRRHFSFRAFADKRFDIEAAREAVLGMLRGEFRCCSGAGSAGCTGLRPASAAASGACGSCSQRSTARPRGLPVLLYPVVAYFYITPATRATITRLSRGCASAARPRRSPHPARHDVFQARPRVRYGVLDRLAMWAGALPASNLEFRGRPGAQAVQSGRWRAVHRFAPWQPRSAARIRDQVRDSR